MKNPLKEHYIGGGGELLKWVEQHKYRNYFSFDLSAQVDFLKNIARIKDEKARELMMELFSQCTNMQKYGEEMHKEFDTLGRALNSVNEQIDQIIAEKEKK